MSKLITPTEITDSYPQVSLAEGKDKEGHATMFLNIQDPADYKLKLYLDLNTRGYIGRKDPNFFKGNHTVKYQCSDEQDINHLQLLDERVWNILWANKEKVWPAIFKEEIVITSMEAGNVDAVEKMCRKKFKPILDVSNNGTWDKSKDKWIEDPNDPKKRIRVIGKIKGGTDTSQMFFRRDENQKLIPVDFTDLSGRKCEKVRLHISGYATGTYAGIAKRIVANQLGDKWAPKSQSENKEDDADDLDDLSGFFTADGVLTQSGEPSVPDQTSTSDDVPMDGGEPVAEVVPMTDIQEDEPKKKKQKKKHK